MFAEFKKLIMRGNVVDLAVGVIIGAAFGKIVTSLVEDMIMPPLGLLLGRVDFSNLYVLMKAGRTPPPYASLDVAKHAGAVTLNYGVFINANVGFLIVAIAIFLMIKAVSKLLPAPPPEDTRDCEFCCTKIPIKAKRCPHCTSSFDAPAGAR